MKLYLNRIEHTIQLGLDIFDDLYKKAAEEVKNYTTDAGYLKRPNQQMESLKAIQQFLVTEFPRLHCLGS